MNVRALFFRPFRGSEHLGFEMEIGKTRKRVYRLPLTGRVLEECLVLLEGLENLGRRAAACAVASPRQLMGKKSESTVLQLCTISASAGRFDDPALRHEPSFVASSLDRQDARSGPPDLLGTSSAR